MNISQTRAIQIHVNDNPGLEIFSKEDKRSVYNLVPPYFQESMDQIPKEYFIMSEKQLRKSCEPDLVDSRLRMAFWTEYQRAQFAGHSMNMGNVYSNICAASTFNEYVVTNPKRLAWILCPPVDWVTGMQAILDQGLHLMFEAVSSPHIVVNGIIDTKALNAVLKIIEKASVAVNGLPVLKTENKTINMNLNQGTPPASLGSQNLEKLQKEVELLRAQLSHGPAQDLIPEGE